MIKNKYNNHYKWLEKHLPGIFEKAGVSWEDNIGIISSHGDKAYGYKDFWAAAGIHFFHGVALYLLSYCAPYSKTCRVLPHGGWCSPDQWVIVYYDEYKKFLPEIEEE